VGGSGLLHSVRMGELQCVASEARRTGRRKDKHRSLPMNGTLAQFILSITDQIFCEILLVL
jgi:hypothetical protein